MHPVDVFVYVLTTVFVVVSVGLGVWGQVRKDEVA